MIPVWEKIIAGRARSNALVEVGILQVTVVVAITGATRISTTQNSKSSDQAFFHYGALPTTTAGLGATFEVPEFFPFIDQNPADGSRPLPGADGTVTIQSRTGLQRYHLSTIITPLRDAEDAQ